MPISGGLICTYVRYKATDTNSYLHHHSLHSRHCKESLLYSQFLSLQRLYSHNANLEAPKMASFFERRGYKARTFDHSRSTRQDLEKCDAYHRYNRPIPLLGTSRQKNGCPGRILLIFTYHPLNNRNKRSCRTT